MYYDVDPHSIVCADANYTMHQTLHRGDSGGPLLLQNGDLLAVTSVFLNFNDSNQVKFMAFTNVPFYYDWIEKVTGLKLPARHGSQAQ